MQHLQKTGGGVPITVNQVLFSIASALFAKKHPGVGEGALNSLFSSPMHCVCCDLVGTSSDRPLRGRCSICVGSYAQRRRLEVTHGEERAWGDSAFGTGTGAGGVKTVREMVSSGVAGIGQEKSMAQLDRITQDPAV